MIAHIPDSESAKIEAYAIYPAGTSDFSDYNNYSYLSVDISYGNGTGINIFCTVKSEMTAKEYVESKPAACPLSESAGSLLLRPYGVITDD